jgi:hypothetical protein
MKKKCLLLTVVAVFALLNGFAQKWETIRHSAPVAHQTKALTNDSYVFGYSTDNLSLSLGYAPDYTVRVAFLIPQEVAASWTGCEITKIHVGFGTSPATSTSVFIIEGSGNTPVYSQTVNFETEQWNIVDLTTPYVITGATDVLVGYEFTGGDESYHSIGVDDSMFDSIEPERNGNYLSVKEGNSYSEWRNLVDYGYYNATLKATITGNIPQYDLSVNSVKPSSYDIYPDESFSIITSFTNTATQTITSIKFACEVDETYIEEVLSGISIAPFKTYYTASKDLSLSNEGTFPVKVTVLELNGGEVEDENDSNNSLSTNYDIWVGNSIPTIPMGRNVVLEEYTGIYCVYCPDGHRVANQLSDKNPGRVAILNIHQGEFAKPSDNDPDFRTTWGDALAGQTRLGGYPSGTINRHAFNGDSTVLYRNEWEAASNIILSQTSPVNLRANAQIDWDTRMLTVNVEGYYTGNSDANTNLLNVALLQENILGPQLGGILYPEMQTNDGLYRHNHMLRHLLTGQWGDTIAQTTSGSSFTKQYIYEIPEDINGVPVQLDNLTVVGFITEGKQEIITGTTSKIQQILYTAPNIDLIRLTQQLHQTADDSILVQAVVRNISQETITAYRLQYGIANEPLTFEVTGKNLLPFENDTIFLPLISIALNEEKTLNVSVQQVNGETPTKPSQMSLKVKKDIVFANTRSLVLKLWQDKYGQETTWALFGSNQELVDGGGPYFELPNAATQLHTIELNILEDDVYRFEIYDAYGDGINAGYGEGKYEIWAGDSKIVSSDGQFGSEEVILISVKTDVSIKNISASDLKVYNYGENLYLISSDPIVHVAVYDLLGKQVISRNYISNPLSLKELEKGIYLVKVLTQTGVEKVVKINR